MQMIYGALKHRVLRAVVVTPGRTALDIGDALGLASRTTSYTLLCRMEARGLVRRALATATPEERRVRTYKWWATDAGVSQCDEWDDRAGWTPPKWINPIRARALGIAA